ncbi:PREDICTED: WASP homolog-associated protein with actin, membranes and microtubules [Ceratotherium simum simum]|uniref:WASP homolog-associated protein with actin, membranes and microtubules n=1 Tax=Ceratotherium simum simum TaxID=73337 RepID=A0ABM1CX83_CERSS|nr:PREDICTED: WASP homolog-associated protein with actin, membranes and microtubules [Ceratotherium simum simum]
MSRPGPPAALGDEQPDSLEGWVPVREDLFAAPERHQLRFLVAWNDAEGKFAVTCHDRTAQRRRRQGSRPGPKPEPEPEPEGPPGSCAGLEGGQAALEPSPCAVSSRVLQRHEKANTMVALMQVYGEEDKAYQELVTVATTFFQYFLQPFRDMREVATSCKLDILKSLEEDDLGPKRIVALQREAQEWARRAEEAIVSIQDITVNYFKETVKALAGMQKQMEQDEKRFGQATWATATPRLEKLKLTLARETLQLMRAKELCLNHRRAEIQGKMEDLPEQEKNINVVDELEIQYYEVQLELYEVKFEILKYEEILLITQLDSIKRLIKDKQDEVVYYDPCESPEELTVVAGVMGLQDEKNLEVEELSRQRQRLESKRGRLCARRACLRRRRDQCKENHQLRLQQAEESIKYFHQHHSIQMKRNKIKEEEQKKKEWINQERQKTLQRLRAFKERRPGQSVRKTSCSEPVAPNLPGGLSQQTGSPTSQRTVGIHQSSGKTRSAPSSEVSNLKTPNCQDCPGNIPVQVSVPVGDQTHSKSSEELSPPPPPPPPPLPPPLPARSFSSQSATRQNLHLRTSVKDDQPLPLVCESPAERRHASSDCFKCPGSMDEVLASLRRSRTPLQKVEVPVLPPPCASVNEHLLAAIRQGVKLKKVHPHLGLSPSKKPTSDLERSIKAALQRIKRVSADSEEEEEEEDSEERSPREWDH